MLNMVTTTKGLAVENASPETSVLGQAGRASSIRVVATNTAMVIAGEFFSKIITAAISILMARKLGPLIYGSYETGLALAYALVLYVNLGMNVVIVRSAVSSNEDMNSFLRTSLFLKMILSVIIFPLAIFTIKIFEYSPLIVQLTEILSIFSAVLAIQTTLEAVFQAKQRLVFVAVAQILGAVVYGGFAFVNYIFHYVRHAISMGKGG